MAEKRDREAYEAELTVKLRSIGFSLERTLFGSWVAFHPLGNKIKLKNLEAVEALYARQTSSGRGFKRPAPGAAAEPPVEPCDSGWQRQGEALQRSVGERRGEATLWSLQCHYRVQWLGLDPVGDAAEPLESALVPLAVGAAGESLTLEHRPPLGTGDAVLALLVRPAGGDYRALQLVCGEREAFTRLEPRREADHRALAELLAGGTEGDWLLAGGNGRLLARLAWRGEEGAFAPQREALLAACRP